MPLNVAENGGGRGDWGTPPEFVAEVERAFGIRFTLDVCATDADRKCERYIAPPGNIPTSGLVAYDGLTFPWSVGGSHEVCWMNPPYGRGEIEKWTARAARQAIDSGATTVALLPASVDTAWFHDTVVGIARIIWVRGRIKFIGADAGAKFASILAVYGWPGPVSTLPHSVTVPRP